MSSGVLYGLSAYVMWGLFPLFFKQLQAASALEVVLHRMVWSLVFVVLVLGVMRRWSWLADVRRSPALLGKFAVSAALLAANWLIYIWAVNNDHVLDASLGYFILPLVNVALGYGFLHERPRKAQWAAFAVAACGVLWLALQSGHMPWIALLLALSFGFYGLMRKVAVLGALEGMSLETMLLAPIALVVLLWGTSSGTMPAHDAHTWLFFVLSGPVTAIPLLLFAAGARRTQLSTMGILQYASPTILALLGVFVYGEPFAGPRAVGFSLIWLALLLYSAEGLWFSRKAAANAAAA
ncbi:EamA family transporter RarD [Curvibacter sp. CHRR-16]|uniref:EamA family transporter RarD n=1 Tax=Curvibacter sp. CHRR-16 TaxID=2835872 RepID=UPI001BDB16D4|nr:EamA family transporter RarD [Curvibacter sp. CHRR-16]MBT0570381.1 EamA family transporter RarD [Curvibacter sp. CHRR-16]